MKEHLYAEIRDNKIFRKAFLEFPSKEIGEIRDSVELSIKYFEDRFSIPFNKVEQLEEKIEKIENKASFLMKVIHMQTFLINFDGLGDFEELYLRLKKQEDILNEIVSNNRIKNLNVKKGYLEELEKLVNHFNLNEAFTGIKEIKSNWIKTGALPLEEKEAIETKYNLLLDHFFERQKSFYNDKKSMIEDHTSKYTKIIKKGTKLVGQQDIKNSFKELKILQKEWKEAEKIPHDIYEPLFKQFKELCDTVFNKYPEFMKNEQVRKTQSLAKQVENRKRIIEDFSKDIDEDKNLDQKLKSYKKKWGNQGVFFHKKIKELNDQFHYLSRKVVEINFVDNTVKGKTKSFSSLNQKDKLKARIRILRSLVDRDKRDLDQIEENLGMFSSKSGAVDKLLNSRVSGKKLNLEIKKELLTDYTAQLNSV